MMHCKFIERHLKCLPVIWSTLNQVGWVYYLKHEVYTLVHVPYNSTHLILV